MFALWRYILFQRPLNDQSLAKERLDLFQEIFWRCWIVAMHEQDLFRHMASRIQDLWQWPNMEQSVIPIPIDLQDSTELIAAFIDRLTPPTDDTSVYDSLSLVDLINCIAFVQQRTLPGAGELLPKCFGAIIERLWYTISHPKESSARIGEVLGTVFTWFRWVWNPVT
ncbi:hypothetical protein FRC11_003431 [Ceratobasidium sp. 423]|nr:hypothetical protein FRC11_003431 [Ceratobasidium sp. 423]